jgi:hypothetical protein
MIRGGHIDLAILGGKEVAENGDPVSIHHTLRFRSIPATFSNVNKIWIFLSFNWIRSDTEQSIFCKKTLKSAGISFAISVDMIIKKHESVQYLTHASAILRFTPVFGDLICSRSPASSISVSTG